MSSEYIQFIVLNLLYDKFESRQSAWTKISFLLDHTELIPFNSNSVATEIDYLAEKGILTGASGTGQPPFTEVKINGAGLHIVRFVLKEFPKYLLETEEKECKDKSKQISAMSEKGKRMEVLAFIKERPNYFDDFAEKTNLLSLNPIPYSTSITQVSTINMYGDIFQNIQNSTIVSKSSLENALNTLKTDDETNKALVKIAEIISNSGNHAAGVLYTTFTDELTRSPRDKPRLKGIWDGIVAILPAVTSVANIASKIVPLFT